MMSDPSNIEITIFENTYANPESASTGEAIVVSSLKELHAIVKSKSWSPFVFKFGKRKKEFFEKTKLLTLDIDSGLSILNARQRLKKLGLSYSITLSKSHLKKKNGLIGDRFRIIVIAEKTIRNGGTYLKTLSQLLKIFPEADPKCIDLARYFYASSGVGETFLRSKGLQFEVHETSRTYDDIKSKIENKNYDLKNLSSKEFMDNAHTGLPGKFNRGVYTTAFNFTKKGKSKEQIIEAIAAVSPKSLDKTDLCTIDSAFKNASESQETSKKNQDQLYLEETSDFLRNSWKDKFKFIEDSLGNRLIVEVSEDLTIKNVTLQYLASQATKLFFETTFLRKPSRIKEAIENYLNLSEPITEPLHSILTMTASGYTYNRLDFLPKNIPTPLFDEFLSRCTNSKAVCAFIYSLFIPESDRQQYLWITGNGGDGKSALARFLEKCIGTAFHAERAGGANNNKHFTASFLGKRLAVFSDSNATRFVTSELFKELSGGDSIKVERKYENPFTAKIDTKFLFLSNSLPTIGSQKSDQRRIILSKIKPISGEPDSSYEKNLWLEKEGILWKCRKEYFNLTKSHGYIVCDRRDSEELAADCEIHFRIMYNETFLTDKNSFMSADDFFKAVRIKCKDYNVPFQEFKNWAARTYNLKTVRNTENKNKRTIKGVCLKYVGPNYPDLDIHTSERYSLSPPTKYPKGDLDA